jgi:CheY-like chemotaxis protein
MLALAIDEAALPPIPGMRVAGMAPRILLAEDDPDMRRLVAATLRRDGYQVVAVSSGVAMLRRMPEDFDAIVSDIQMPDLTALEVLEALRCREIATPVVLMTAYGSEDARIEASALGAFAVLDKPLDWDALRTTVRQAVLIG